LATTVTTTGVSDHESHGGSTGSFAELEEGRRAAVLAGPCFSTMNSKVDTHRRASDVIWLVSYRNSSNATFARATDAGRML
jgi:hypothetical protein